MRRLDMAKTLKPTGDAVEILHRRVYEGKPARLKKLEEARAISLGEVRRCPQLVDFAGDLLVHPCAAHAEKFTSLEEVFRLQSVERRAKPGQRGYTAA